MTEKEAIEELITTSGYYLGELTEPFQLAIKALEEIQAYRAIGAVEEIQSMKDNGSFSGVELAQIAIMQMRLKEFEAIGTVEEFKALKEKAEPKEPIIIDNRFNEVEWKCPVCGLNVIEEPPCQEYCQRCGQKLDWN